jgi:DNA invertase Pin-like site-specific DNA recombinase
MTMTATPRKVNIIQPRANLQTTPSSSEYRKRRVAAYARVSTDSDEQLTSYEAQVDYYTRHIQSNPEWEFVSVYTDEGISGTNMKKRDGFNRMIAHALDGKIDLILTKSISRFARNTVDSLTTVRKLKEKGIEIYFEKENIYTLDAKGEVLITIMSSLAQEESRSISENVSWGKKKSMQDGKISLPYKRFLGYEKGENNLPKIVEAEAKIIREIYALFLEGTTIRNITRHLTEQGILTPSGKEKWSVSTVMSILSNEKYKGDALLQKTYTVDFLSKTIKKNDGEVPQYYIENSHPAIIDPKTFNLVQIEIEKRQPNRRQLNNNSPFAAKIICGACGGYYGSKVWHSTSKYRYHIWQCNRKYANENQCNTPHLRENELKQAFIQAFNQIISNKDRYISNFEVLLPLLADTSPLDKKLEELESEHDTTIDEMRRYMEENTREVRDQVKYNRNYQEINTLCRGLESQISKIKHEISDQNARKEKIRHFLYELRRADDLVSEFDQNLWLSTVESVKVNPDKTLVFLYKDGTEITVKAISTSNA